jgi:transaldolase
MFSVSQYAGVAKAYLRGIERNAEPRKVTSVASFFVSRVDTAVDRALEDIGTEEAFALRGKAGVANARLAYHYFRQTFSTPEFEKMKNRGVRIQKPLWASTGTKNKNYSDVMYIEGLIGPDTINSMPPETLAAFRDHGKPQIRLGQNDEAAEEVQGKLLSMEVNLRSIGQELTNEGVEKFIASYDELIATLEKKRAALPQTRAA